MVGRLVLLSPTAAPEVRQRLSRLASLPWPARDHRQPARWRRGRWRVLLLRLLHGVLGEGASLRLLNVAEYGCASFIRAAGALRAAVREPIERALPCVGAPVLVIRGDHDHLSAAVGWPGCRGPATTRSTWPQPRWRLRPRRFSHRVVCPPARTVVPDA
jgi:hypothetical protein